MTEPVAMVRCPDMAAAVLHGPGGFSWDDSRRRRVCYVVFPAKCPYDTARYVVAGVRHPWNGDRDRPTFLPSVLVRTGPNDVAWHGYIVGGRMATTLEALGVADMAALEVLVRGP